MICNEARELLQGYADDQLLARDKQGLEEHLATCAACRAEADKARENTGFLRERLALLRDKVKPDPAGLTGLAAPTPPPPPPPPSRPAAAREKRGAPLALAFLLFATIVFAAIWYFVIRPNAAGPEPGPAVAAGEAGAGTGAAKPPPVTPPRPEGGRPPTGTTEKPPVKPPTPAAAATPEEALTRLLAAPGPSTLDRLAQLLSKAPDRAAEADRMLAALPGEKDEVRRACRALALGALREEPGVREALLGLLGGDGSPKVRQAAAAALLPPGAAIAVPLTGIAPGLAASAGPVEDEDLRGRLTGALEVEADPATLSVLLRLLGPSAAIDEGIAARLWELSAAPEDDLRQAALAGLRFAPPDTARLATLLGSDQVPLADRKALLPRLAQSGAEDAGARLADLAEQATDEEWQQALFTAMAAPGLAAGPVSAAALRVLLQGEAGAGVKAAALRVIAEAAAKDDGALAMLDDVANNCPDAGIAEQARTLHTRLSEQRRVPEDQGQPPPERDPGEEPRDER